MPSSDFANSRLKIEKKVQGLGIKSKFLDFLKDDLSSKQEDRMMNNFKYNIWCSFLALFFRFQSTFICMQQSSVNSM